MYRYLCQRRRIHPNNKQLRSSHNVQTINQSAGRHFSLPLPSPYLKMPSGILERFEKSSGSSVRPSCVSSHLSGETTMITLLPSHFVLEEVTGYDLAIASLAWGFTLGIGWLTTWTAMKQTTQVYRRHGLGIFYNAYVWMIWGDIFVCLAFGIICFMYLLAVIQPR